MTRRLQTLSVAVAQKVEKAAAPHCPECHGTGVIPAEWLDDERDDQICGCVDPRVLRAFDTPPSRD